DLHHPFAQWSDPRWRESTLDEAEAVRGEIGLGLRTVFGRQAKRKRFGQIPRHHGNANVARSGGVAEWFRQGPAKPCTAVRFRSPPLGVLGRQRRFPRRRADRVSDSMARKWRGLHVCPFSIVARWALYRGQTWLENPVEHPDRYR